MNNSKMSQFSKPSNVLHQQNVDVDDGFCENADTVDVK